MKAQAQQQILRVIDQHVSAIVGEIRVILTQAVIDGLGDAALLLAEPALAKNSAAHPAPTRPKKHGSEKEAVIAFVVNSDVALKMPAIQEAFPHVNPKTLHSRLTSAVKKGQLHKGARGYSAVRR